VGQDQPVLGAGGGDIEEPTLLAQRLGSATCVNDYNASFASLNGC
jgi:hypothetical protein